MLVLVYAPKNARSRYAGKMYLIKQREDWASGAQKKLRSFYLMAKPYYQDEWVTIYHGDCREILPQLPMADLILTDPPYLVGRFDKGRNGYERFCLEWFSQALLRGKCLVFTSGLANMGIYYRIKEPTWVICWRVSNTCSHSPIGGFVGWEPILVYGKPPKVATRDFWSIPISIYSSSEIDKHDFPKPEELMSNLILDLTNGGDLIIDPFLGSGTTAWCSKKLNRKCIGIEIEEKYCEIAANRCRQMVMDFSH